MRRCELTNGTLTIDKIAVLADVPANAIVEPDPRRVGTFVGFKATSAAHHFSCALGTPQITRWAACYRDEPWWMKPRVGKAVADVPAETQVLYGEMADGKVALFVPIIDGAMRCALIGAAGNKLSLVVDSDDPAVVADRVIGLFIAIGDDIHTLVREAAASVMAHMKTGRLRHEKSLPRFIDSFGWCTWDAFYADVSAEKVREGLETFKAGGITPRLLILDDGWQSVKHHGELKHYRLTSFAANEKFPGDLAPTVQMAKHDFGVEHFLVWHSFQGYWGGVDAAAMPQYGVRDITRNFCEGLKVHFPEVNSKYWGSVSGIYDGALADRFFHDYHRHLRAQGVDGVKVDNQATNEGLCLGQGGRVRFNQRCREALEGSTQVHFAGNLINCMGCSNDLLYSTLSSTVTRTSTDFWPRKPETHGLHLHTNALVCLWFGEFVHGDWDMFQSGHEWGAYHAAARAISGSPVYVSDKPGQHDFALLKKMVFSDGSVPWINCPATIARDCLFNDVRTEDVLLKIVNHCNGTNVIGVFNARYWPEERDRRAIAGSVCATDRPGLAADEFVVYLHNRGEIREVSRDERIAVSLGQREFEIATFTPIRHGFAVIGLTDKFNSAGTYHTHRHTTEKTTILARDGGELAVWCEKSPARVTTRADEALAFTFAGNILRITIPGAGPRMVEIDW